MFFKKKRRNVQRNNVILELLACSPHVFVLIVQAVKKKKHQKHTQNKSDHQKHFKSDIYDLEEGCLLKMKS